VVSLNNGEKGTFNYGENFKGHFEITAPYTLQTDGEEIPLDALITLSYYINGEFVISPLPVSSSPAYFGNKRYWVLCPAYKNGRICLKRSYKLYLPKNAKYFCCRECHELTYKSVQTRDKRVEELLKNPMKLYAILMKPIDYKNLPTEYFLGLKALTKYKDFLL